LLRTCAASAHCFGWGSAFSHSVCFLLHCGGGSGGGRAGRARPKPRRTPPRRRQRNCRRGGILRAYDGCGARSRCCCGGLRARALARSSQPGRGVDAAGLRRRGWRRWEWRKRENGARGAAACGVGRKNGRCTQWRARHLCALSSAPVRPPRARMAAATVARPFSRAQSSALLQLPSTWLSAAPASTRSRAVVTRL
jgi:hypothetical protein